MIEKCYLSDSKYILIERKNNRVCARIIEAGKPIGVLHTVAITSSGFCITSKNRNLAVIDWKDKSIQNTILIISGNVITVKPAEIAFGEHLINLT